MTEKKLNRTIKLTVYLYSGTGGKSENCNLPVKVVYNSGSIRVQEDESRDIKSTCAFPFNLDSEKDHGSSVQSALRKALETTGVKIVNTEEEMEYEIEKYIAEKNYEEAKRERDRVLSKKQKI